MNKTKRKIFEISMKLFAEKGYDGTSVEEITAVVGIAKGTLYYHFSSKEEIFNFLIDEGMKLLQNSIDIKLAKCTTTDKKIKSIIMIQNKILVKYQDLVNIFLSQLWGTESRNLRLKDYINNYTTLIENIVITGIENKELRNDIDPTVFSSAIFGLLCSSLFYKKKTNVELDIHEIQNQYEKILFESLK